MGNHIAWKDYYSVGDSTIDAQHRQIIAMINELYDAMSRNIDFTVVKPLLGRLRRYTMEHFDYEETVRAAHSYPELVQHKILHDKMRQRTIDYYDNANLLTGRDMLVFLKEWWSNHIQNQDQKYAPFLVTAVSC